MPADYRSTLGFLALRERAANQERQRAEIAQKLLQDRSGMADSVRHTTNLMELAVRAAGQKQRGDLAVAKLLAESEGALGRPRTQFADAPVEDMSEAGYAAGEASRLPPLRAEMNEEDLNLRQRRLDIDEARNKTYGEAVKANQMKAKSTDLATDVRLKIAAMNDRTKRLSLRLAARMGAQSNLVSQANIIQDEVAAIAKAESDLLGAGYASTSPEVLKLHEKLDSIQGAQEDLEAIATELEAEEAARKQRAPRSGKPKTQASVTGAQPGDVDDAGDDEAVIKAGAAKLIQTIR